MRRAVVRRSCCRRTRRACDKTRRRDGEAILMRLIMLVFSRRVSVFHVGRRATFAYREEDDGDA